jgi:hypothetical protein
MDNFDRSLDKRPERAIEPASAAPHQPLAPDRPFTRQDRNPALAERPADTPFTSEFVRLRPTLGETPVAGNQSSTPTDKIEAAQPETSDPSADVVSHLSVTATTPEVTRQSDSESGIPEGAADSEALRNEGHERREQPFTIVEFGPGGSPVLRDIDAPDVRKLYQEGGKYIAVDPVPWSLRTTALVADHHIDEHAYSDVEIDAEFYEARIVPDAPLPKGLSPGTANRVVIGNVFTHKPVAEKPEQCQAIASAAAELLAPDGEVVAIGTLSPSVFPKDRLTQLMSSVGLEHVGSDDVSLHYPREFRGDIPADVYAERYRRRQENQPG